MPPWTSTCETSWASPPAGSDQPGARESSSYAARTPAPPCDHEHEGEGDEGDHRRDLVIFRRREELARQSLREVDARVHQDGHQDAAAGVVVDPGDDDRERDGRQEEDGDPAEAQLSV